jgi:hypothetical protein
LVAEVRGRDHFEEEGVILIRTVEKQIVRIRTGRKWSIFNKENHIQFHVHIINITCNPASEWNSMVGY